MAMENGGRRADGVTARSGWKRRGSGLCPGPAALPAALQDARQSSRPVPRLRGCVLGMLLGRCLGNVWQGVVADAQPRCWHPLRGSVARDLNSDYHAHTPIGRFVVSRLCCCLVVVLSLSCRCLVVVLSCCLAMVGELDKRRRPSSTDRGHPGTWACRGKRNRPDKTRIRMGAGCSEHTPRAAIRQDQSRDRSWQDWRDTTRRSDTLQAGHPLGHWTPRQTQCIPREGELTGVLLPLALLRPPKTNTGPRDTGTTGGGAGCL